MVKLNDEKLFVVLQMTINLNHGIKSKPMLDLLKWIDPSFSVCFVFVVPNDDLATQFAAQKFLTVRNTVYKKNPDVSLTKMQQCVCSVDILKKLN